MGNRRGRYICTAHAQLYMSVCMHYHINTDSNVLFCFFPPLLLTLVNLLIFSSLVVFPVSFSPVVLGHLFHLWVLGVGSKLKRKKEKKLIIAC